MDEQSYLERARECERTLYRVSWSILYDDADCADAVQQAVFKGWIKRRQLRDPEKFKAWLTRILINECRNLQRNGARQRRIEEAALQRTPDRARVENEALYEALSELPEHYRLPVVLHYLEGYSIREISGMLKVPERRVKDCMYRARQRLKEVLKL